MQQSAPVQAQAPTVHAVRCPSGHLNAPHATSCRSCGAPVADQEPVTVPRPVLGTLRFADGREVQLNGPLILGRNPRLEGQSADEAPQLVTLASPLKEMSSTHLEVRVEGWQVLLVDCRSTNGTVVQLPGREAQKLRPAEPFPIIPGTTVNLADEAEFVYEASP